MPLALSKKPSSPAVKTEKKQRRLFKKTRAGVVLSREEVKAIKQGRKKLRKEMRARGLKKRQDFEATAASLGLYFDKRNKFLAWLGLHWLGTLLGALAALLALLFLLSLVQYMRGRFTIHLSDEMFREGFTLSDNVAFYNPTTMLFAVPAEDVPCISIMQVPDSVDMIDGEHNEQYFAYTFYIRNEGESTVGYTWELAINHETLDLSSACWVGLYEDGALTVYAEGNAFTGLQEALPSFDDNTRGYMAVPILEQSGNSQLEVVADTGPFTYYRVVPEPFLSDDLITRGRQVEVEPMEVHKYTVVMWLEGDDPDCTDDLIGGTMGVEMDFRLEHEGDEEDDNSLGVRWKKFWKRVWGNMDFWEDG